MARKYYGRYEGTLPVREFNWHFEDLRRLLQDPSYSLWVIEALIAGGYLTDKDICQLYYNEVMLYPKESIRVEVEFDTDNHTFKVKVSSWEVKGGTLKKIAQRIAEAFLRYEEDMYQKCQERLSDTSWQQLRGKLRVPLKFLKGEMLDNYVKVIEDLSIARPLSVCAFWEEPAEVPKVISEGIVGADIKVHREECFVEITTYIKDIKRAYNYHDDMEVFLMLVARRIDDAIRNWELSVCVRDAFKGVVVNG